MFTQVYGLKKIVVVLCTLCIVIVAPAQQPPNPEDLNEYVGQANGWLFSKPAFIDCRLGIEKNASETIISTAEGTWSANGERWFSGAITTNYGGYDLYFNGYGNPYDAFLVNINDRKNPLLAAVWLKSASDGSTIIIIEKRLTLKSQQWGEFKVFLQKK